jgi:hypothetical protein
MGCNITDRPDKRQEWAMIGPATSEAPADPSSP